MKYIPDVFNYFSIFESYRKADAKKKFEKEIGKNTWKKIEDSTLPPGYYYWVAKEYLRLKIMIDIEQIIDAAEWFISVKPRLSTAKRDIYFKKGNFSYTYDKIEAMMNSMGESKNASKKMKGLAEKGTRVLFKDTKGNMLIQISTWEASKYWAHYYMPTEITEGRWCISTYSGRFNYDTYAKRGSIFMIIIPGEPFVEVDDKSKTNYGRIAIVTNNYQSSDENVLTAWAATNEVGINMLQLKNFLVKKKIYKEVSKNIPELFAMEELHKSYKNKKSKLVQEGSEILYDKGDKFLVRIKNKAAMMYWGIFRDPKKPPCEWVEKTQDIKMSDSSDVFTRGNKHIYLLSAPKFNYSSIVLKIDRELDEPIHLMSYTFKYGVTDYYNDLYMTVEYPDIKDSLIENGMFKIVYDNIPKIKEADFVLLSLQNKKDPGVKSGSEILYNKKGETLIKIETSLALMSWGYYQEYPNIKRNGSLAHYIDVKIDDRLNYIYISKKLKERFYITTKNFSDSGVRYFDNEDKEKRDLRIQKKIEVKNYLDNVRGSNVEVHTSKGISDYGSMIDLIEKSIPDSKELLKLLPGGDKYKAATNKISKIAAQPDHPKVKDASDIFYEDKNNVFVETTNKYADTYWTYKYTRPGLKPLRANLDMMIGADSNYKITKGARVHLLISSDLPAPFNRIKIFKGTNTGHLMFHIIGKVPNDVQKKLKDNNLTIRNYLIKLFKIYLPLPLVKMLIDKKFIKKTKNAKDEYELEFIFKDEKSVQNWNFRNFNEYLKDYSAFVFKKETHQRANWNFINFHKYAIEHSVYFFNDGIYKGRRVLELRKGYVYVYFNEKGKNITKYFNDKLKPSYPILKEWFAITGSTADVKTAYKEAKKSKEYKNLLKVAVDMSNDKNIKEKRYTFTSKLLYDLYSNDKKLDMKKIPKVYVSPKFFVGKLHGATETPDGGEQWNPIFKPEEKFFLGQFEKFYTLSFKWLLDNIDWTDRGLKS